MGPKGKPNSSRGKAAGQQAHKQVTTREATKGTAQTSFALSSKAQQEILDVFAQTFRISDDASQLASLIQEVKGHLFNRDFHSAFGRPEYLNAYAIRWSAARALAYAEIFSQHPRRVWLDPVGQQQRRQQDGEEADPRTHLAAQNPIDTDLTKVCNVAQQTDDTASTVESPALRPDQWPTKIVCVGGGAGAEILALAAASIRFGLLHPLHLVAVDIANWELPVNQLATALSTPPTLSPYASQSVKDANHALINSDQIVVNFIHGDVLDPDLMLQRSQHAAAQDQGPDIQHVQNKPGLTRSSAFADASLVTIMFTLNELFSVSLPRTTAFLLQLTDVLPSGSHLVVVDSPGSYSEIMLSQTQQAKKYPMKWLLDHTLLEAAGTERWIKVEEDDSTWFRLDERRSELKYPINLENCRYQIHVYQKR